MCVLPEVGSFGLKHLLKISYMLIIKPLVVMDGFFFLYLCY